MPFIDGLRAVSILSVVAFHVGVPGFGGGYVGVDIFFVISGFLIINQIKADLEGGRPSIVLFYSRRSLRILPPFVVVLLATFVLGLLLLPTPDVFEDFVGAALTAPIMASNIFFFMRQGYFDLNADEKPLLHTWTLSVEEQFYLLAPVVLMLIFRLGRNRFGTMAYGIGSALGLISVAGAIIETHSAGKNPAFYLPYWRAWEFAAGGLISGSLVAIARRAPRVMVESSGWIGFAGIGIAVNAFDAHMPYPSWRAIVPVVGAALIILSGIAQPRSFVIRLLTWRWLVAIGLVSYGWYLWHWPLLSFWRICRFGDASLWSDLLVGGLIAFTIACGSYVFIERPLRRWRASGIRNPGRIVRVGVAVCLGAALIGGVSSAGGYLATRSLAVSRYGFDGRGVLDNGCRIVTSSALPDSCLGTQPSLLLGDSRADALSGSFTRYFDERGIRLVTIARGGCDPLRFSPTERRTDRRHGCSNLLGPFERLMAAPQAPGFVIVTSAWLGSRDSIANRLTDFLSQFAPYRTRILVIGPVPMFAKSSLECIVLSDRYGEDRDRCIKPRAMVEADLAPARSALPSAVAGFRNALYADTLDLFCDHDTCRPFSNHTVFYRDGSHVSPAGADHMLDGFADDVRWLIARGDFGVRQN